MDMSGQKGFPWMPPFARKGEAILGDFWGRIVECEQSEL
jgi:hypothetical protein